jgi:Cdc6-like AAA superfamily ATPase
MNELTSIIEDYLYQKNTDYAIFINGKWSTGKTYYAKNLTKVAS